MGVAPQSVHDPAALGRAETGSWKITSQRKNRFVIGATRTGSPTTCSRAWRTLPAAATGALS